MELGKTPQKSSQNTTGSGLHELITIAETMTLDRGGSTEAGGVLAQPVIRVDDPIQTRMILMRFMDALLTKFSKWKIFKAAYSGFGSCSCNRCSKSAFPQQGGFFMGNEGKKCG
ncbi:MAG: hypothetical protein D6814_15680 [Calditrichaeota bacterium]|nr:MAG: hypothetical protein D6814_15680 [Calditrichota bacterium]